jgi:hypothetical protein
MLGRALHDITRMRIHATDGDLGHVHDVYIEDGQWRVRYLQVDTRHWLLDRHVLLAPTAVQSLDWEHGRLHVALTPGAGAEQPRHRLSQAGIAAAPDAGILDGQLVTTSPG